VNGQHGFWKLTTKNITQCTFKKVITFHPLLTWFPCKHATYPWSWRSQQHLFCVCLSEVEEDMRVAPTETAMTVMLHTSKKNFLISRSSLRWLYLKRCALRRFFFKWCLLVPAFHRSYYRNESFFVCVLIEFCFFWSGSPSLKAVWDPVVLLWNVNDHVKL